MHRQQSRKVDVDGSRIKPGQGKSKVHHRRPTGQCYPPDQAHDLVEIIHRTDEEAQKNQTRQRDTFSRHLVS